MSGINSHHLTSTICLQHLARCHGNHAICWDYYVTREHYRSYNTTNACKYMFLHAAYYLMKVHSSWTLIVAYNEQSVIVILQRDSSSKWRNIINNNNNKMAAVLKQTITLSWDLVEPYYPVELYLDDRNKYYVLVTFLTGSLDVGLWSPWSPWRSLYRLSRGSAVRRDPDMAWI